MEFKMEKNGKLNNALYTEVEMFKLMDVQVYLQMCSLQTYNFRILCNL